jgi:VCBS repeat protein
MGSCHITACDMGFGDCDVRAENGCEVALATDPRNCGGCGNACAAGPHATIGCVSALCAVTACDAGFADCDKDAGDGCEASLLSLTSCGACGVVCKDLPHASLACKAGVCGVGICTPPWADCDGLGVDGCERDLTNDALNCGACGHVCAGAHAGQSCDGGACTITFCDAGFADCDGQVANGCEVNLGTDAGNCGSCGNACGLPNASSVCRGGACAIDLCQPGFADCDADVKDGCETDLHSVKSCGACGNVCPTPANATAACNAEVCGMGACNNLFGDCDGKAANGCEIDLAVDANHCGNCGVACSFANAQPQCVNGQCVLLQCNPGWGDCDNKSGNGCEDNVSIDVANCGKCGVNCPQGQVCRRAGCTAPVKLALAMAPVVNYPVGTYPYGIAAADLDGDGKLDLLTDDNNGLSFLKGVGDGTFKAALASPLPGRAVGLALGDLDSDGRLDAVVGDSNGYNIRVLPGRGDGSFAMATSYTGGLNSYYQKVGDINGDGKLDIVASDSSGTGDYTVLINKGNGTFNPAAVVKTCLGPEELVLRDLNGDGKIDVAFSCGGFQGGLLGVHMGKGDGTFGPIATYASGGQPWGMAAGDVDRDGDLDLVVANDDDSNVGVYINPGNGLFKPRVVYPSGKSNPSAVAVEDLDGDAWPDLAVANASGNNIAILLNNGDGTFGAPQTFPVHNEPILLALGDFNGDGMMDIASANFNDVSVLINTSK